MLYNHHPLYFPKLKFIKEGSLVRKSEKGESGRPIDLYKLDWLKQEEIIRNKHEDWKKEYHPDKNLPFVGQLPKEWDEWIKSLVFAIDRGYLREIRYWAREALTHWNRSNYASADTMVREICLKPAISMIQVAFFLIGDCIYNEEKKWYARAGKGFLAEYALPYKFWAYQTGRGLLWDHAGLDRLQWSVKHSTAAIKRSNDEFIIEGTKFLRDIKKYETELDEAYEELAICMPTDDRRNDQLEGVTSKVDGTDGI